MITYDVSKRIGNLRKHVKHKTTSAMPFSDEQMAAALADAPKMSVDDVDNPPTERTDWENAIVSRSLPELRNKLAKRRRGPQKQPLKVPTTIRFDADVLDALRSSGKGWQTRVNDAMREWVEAHGLTGERNR